MKYDNILVTLDDGRIFPCWGTEILSWDICSGASLKDELEGYPRTRAIIHAMRIERPEQLRREIADLQRHQFDRCFGSNARKLLTVIHSELGNVP